VLDLADQTGLMRIPATGLAANVAAHTGELDGARSLVARALADARSADERMYELNLLHSLGFIESSSGDQVAAAATYERARSVSQRLGARHITVLRAALHEAEAAATTGLLDQAEEALATYESSMPTLTPAWLENVRLRAAGLVAAAGGDMIEARTMFEAATATPDATAPLETARTQLAYGAWLRRMREHSAARAELESAKGAFERMGAAAWTKLASVELARIPGRTRGGDNQLTDAERRIAELVAAGSSNKAVAATLFVSVHTIEAALTRVYRKLGLRSRSELAARFAGDAEL
jgi:DNA-binding CsgD family transcriptional regulator